jgi:hypothetical protein
MLKRLHCRLFGHADTVIQWGTVAHLSGNRIARELTEVCERCHRAVNVSTVRLEEGRWTA